MNILGNTLYTAQRDLLGEIVVWVLIRLAKSIPHSAAGMRCKIPSYASSYTLPSAISVAAGARCTGEHFARILGSVSWLTHITPAAV